MHPLPAEFGFLSLAVVLLATAVISVPIARTIRLSAIVAYLAAGVLIGPWGIGIFRAPETILAVAELGVDTVSNSPYGLVAPKGVPAQVVKVLHDGFKKAMDDADNLKTLQLLDQNYWYKSSEDYRKWAMQTLAAERLTIERIGLLVK